MKKGNVIYKSPEWKFKVEVRMANVTPFQYYACLIGRNGEVVFTGETRKSKSGLIKTVNRLFPGVTIVDKSIPTPSKKSKKK
jgi:hypothetical protein